MLPFISFGLISVAGIMVGKRNADARKTRQRKKPRLSSSSIEIVSHKIQEEKHMILSSEEIPMDNRYGNKLLSSEHEFSQTASVSLSLGNNRRMSAEHKSTLWKIIESKTALEMSRNLGVEVGSQISRRVRLKFATEPGEFVRYQVVWQQQNQRGIFTIRAGKRMIELPYLIHYGLTHSVTSLPGESLTHNQSELPQP